MNQVLVVPLEVRHAGFNLSFPPRGHIDISTFNFQLHAAPVLVDLICLVRLVYLVFWLNETNRINITNQRNQADRAWFSCNLLIIDISKRCAVLERRHRVRG